MPTDLSCSNVLNLSTANLLARFIGDPSDDQVAHAIGNLVDLFHQRGTALADLASMPVGVGAGGLEVTFQSVVASGVQAAFATSGITYLPFVKAAADTIVGTFIAPSTGNFELIASYAMSAAHAGAVSLQLDHNIVPVGAAPTQAITTQAAFTVTPGAITTVLTLSSTDSATLKLALTKGSFVWVRLSRPVAGDVHTGDLRVLKLGMRKVA